MDTACELTNAPGAPATAATRQRLDQTLLESIAAGAKCVVTLVFEPAASGARAATLSITDSATGSPQSVALSGAGTERKRKGTR